MVNYDDYAQFVYVSNIRREEFRVQQGWRMWIAEFALVVPMGGECIRFEQDDAQMRVTLTDSGGYERDAYVQLYRYLDGFEPALCEGMAMHGFVWGSIPANQEPDHFVLDSSDGPITVDLTARSRLIVPPHPFPIDPALEDKRMGSLIINNDTLFLRVAPLPPTQTDDGADQLNFHVELENRGGFDRSDESIVIHAYDNYGRFFNANIGANPLLTVVPGSRAEWDHAVRRDNPGYPFQPGMGDITRVYAQVWLQDETTKRYYLLTGFYHDFDTTPVVDIPIPQQTAEAFTAAVTSGMPPITAANAAQARQLASYNLNAHGLAFSPDGRLLAVVDRKTMFLLDPITGQVQHEFDHRQNVTEFAISPDSRWLATASMVGYPLTVWDVATGQAVFSVDWSPTFPPVFAPDSAWFAYVTATGTGRNSEYTVHIFDLATLRDIHVFSDLITDTMGGSSVRLVGAGPDGDTLVLADSDSIWWWDITTQTERSRVEFEANGLRIGYNASGDRVLLANSDGDIGVFNLSSGARLFEADVEYTFRNLTVFSADGEFLAYLVKSNTHEECRTVDQGDGTSRRECTTVEDDSTNFYMVMVATSTGQETGRIGPLSEFPESAALSPDGSILAEGRGYTPDEHNGISLWDTRTGQFLASMEGDIVAPKYPAFSPDGSLLASFGTDVSVWGIAP